MSDQLLKKVHKRIGGVGIDIQTFGGDHSVEIRWRREYPNDGLSDERWIKAPALSVALREVLAYEDWADQVDAEEEALASS